MYSGALIRDLKKSFVCDEDELKVWWKNPCERILLHVQKKATALHDRTTDRTKKLVYNTAQAYIKSNQWMQKLMARRI